MDHHGNGLESLDLPQNIPATVRLLAISLIQKKPEGAIYISPVEPREHLALHEAWKAIKGDVEYVVCPCSVHPALPLSEKKRQLQIAYHRLGIDCISVPESSTSDLQSWRDWEESAMQNPEIDRATIYKACTALLVRTELPPPPLYQNHYSSVQRRGPVVAIFGDWILGDEFFKELAGMGITVAFVQKAFDLIHSLAGFSTDACWLDSFAFRPFTQRLPTYLQALTKRGVEQVLGVYCSFAHDQMIDGAELSELDRPVLILECEAPGFLSESGRIRLENFFARETSCKFAERK